jgi:hypothetical protein
MALQGKDGAKPYWSLGVYTASTFLDPGRTKAPNPAGWRSASNDSSAKLEITHLIAHQFNGKEINSNLITASFDSNRFAK